MSESLYKFHFLNYHLIVIYIKITLYIFLVSNIFSICCLYFQSSTTFLYIVCALESHSYFLSLSSEKSGTKEDYIWIAI